MLHRYNVNQHLRGHTSDKWCTEQLIFPLRKSACCMHLLPDCLCASFSRSSRAASSSLSTSCSCVLPLLACAPPVSLSAMTSHSLMRCYCNGRHSGMLVEKGAGHLRNTSRCDALHLLDLKAKPVLAPTEDEYLLRMIEASEPSLR